MGEPHYIDGNGSIIEQAQLSTPHNKSNFALMLRKNKENKKQQYLRMMASDSLM